MHYVMQYVMHCLPELVEVVDGELASVGRERLERRGRRRDLVDSVGARTAEDHDVEQAVGQGRCVST